MDAANLAIPFEDADLVRQCRNGHSAAFDRLVVKYQDRVFNACLRFCGNHAEAEDLTQEAFIRALRSINRFDGRARFYTWVFRIAMNLAISAKRKKNHPTRSLDAAREDQPRNPISATLSSPVNSPSQSAAENETHQIVLAALQRLDEDHRAVVILRDLESLSYDEIAAMLEIPPGTVKSRLHRARLALREYLTPILADA